MEMITKTEHGTYNVTLRGKFTFNDNTQFREVIHHMSDPAIRQVVLHMSEVEFVDSAGLGMLLLAHDEAGKHDKSLLLSGVQGQVKRIFKMACFEQFFKF